VDMAYTNTAYSVDMEGSWAKEIELKRSSPSGRSLKDVFAPDSQSIGIIGSGDFGRALAGRLAQAGYSPVIGSRDPDKVRSLIPSGVEVSSQEVACRNDILIIAVPAAFYASLPADLLRHKILVDVSNRNSVKRTEPISQAEYLASLFPDSRVVKAFNVLSAYALESGGIQGSKQVYVAGDEDGEAKRRVSELVRRAGFVPVDLGGITAARTIEDIPVSLFPSWRKPLLIHILLFCFLYALTFAKIQICWPMTWSPKWLWDHIPMDNMNKTLAVHALISLALCYLPGVIAAWLQIARGTKYSRFPNWLDHWLKMRKQLGLLMLFAASIHACLSLGYMSPTYQTLVYGQAKEAYIPLLEGGWEGKTLTFNNTVPIYGTEKMDWRGECFLMTGVFGFGLVVILGISSLPSVTQTLSWKEFACIQSGLGWTALIFLCAHDIFYGWPYLNSPSCYIPSSFQYALYIPVLTLVLKAPLVLPPLSTHLASIRGGYVRGSTSQNPA